MLPIRNIIGEKRDCDSHLIGAWTREERDAAKHSLIGEIPPRWNYSGVQVIIIIIVPNTHWYGALAPRRIGWAGQLSLILQSSCIVGCGPTMQAYTHEENGWRAKPSLAGRHAHTRPLRSGTPYESGRDQDAVG